MNNFIKIERILWYIINTIKENENIYIKDSSCPIKYNNFMIKFKRLLLLVLLSEKQHHHQQTNISDLFSVFVKSSQEFIDYIYNFYPLNQLSTDKHFSIQLIENLLKNNNSKKQNIYMDGIENMRTEACICDMAILFVCVTNTGDH